MAKPAHQDTVAADLARPGNLTHGVDDVGIGDGPGRHPASGVLPGPVGPRGDLTALLAQYPADRLDPVALGPHGVDEPLDQRLRGSSSPAQKVVAPRRIPTPSRSRGFSAFRSFVSATTPIVTPSPFPPPPPT